MYSNTQMDANPMVHPNRNSIITSADAPAFAHQIDKALRILRMKQLIERTQLSRATLYVLMANDPTFPRKINLSSRSIGFLESELESWIVSRAESRVAPAIKGGK